MLGVRHVHTSHFWRNIAICYQVKQYPTYCFYHACMAFISDDWHVHTILHQSTWSAISQCSDFKTRVLQKWVLSGLRPVQFVWNQRRLHTIIGYPPPPLYRLRNHVVPTLVALHAILSWRLSLSVHSDESCPRQLSWANYSQKYRAGPWSERISIAPRSTSIDRQ